MAPIHHRVILPEGGGETSGMAPGGGAIFLEGLFALAGLLPSHLPRARHPALKPPRHQRLAGWAGLSWAREAKQSGKGARGIPSFPIRAMPASLPGSCACERQRRSLQTGDVHPAPIDGKKGIAEALRSRGDSRPLVHGASARGHGSKNSPAGLSGVPVGGTERLEGSRRLEKESQKISQDHQR
jgi:hypothetical protein